MIRLLNIFQNLFKTYTIDVQYHDIDPYLEQKDGSDWIDLRAAETVEIPKFTSKKISLGVSMKLPRGYEAHVVPRSSTFKNFHVMQTNHQGVIDNKYCGPDDVWQFSAYAVEDTVIHKGDRICQFRIMKKQPSLRFNSVERLSGNNRGGWGSTGIR